MISNENFINNNIVELIEVYKFCFCYFSIRLSLNNSKFEFQNMRTLYKTLG